MSADDYSRPERAAELAHAHRVKYRMDAKRARCTDCCICIYRDTSFGVFHCRNRPDRRHPVCDQDGNAPRFQFDDSTLKEFADAA